MFAGMIDTAGIQSLLDLNSVDTIQRASLGTPVIAVDSSGFGLGEFMYVTNGAGGAIGAGALVVWTNAYVVSACPATANLGRPVGVLATPFTATGQFGWVQIGGNALATLSALLVVAGPVFRGTAGNVTGTAAAGTHLVGVQGGAATSYSITRSAVTQNGSNVVTITGLDMAQARVGMPITGTGIPGGTTISSISDNGRTVLMSAAATASGVITATIGGTGWGQIFLQRPSHQGQIT